MSRVRVVWIFVAVVFFCVYEKEVTAGIPDPYKNNTGVTTQIDVQNLDGRVEISTLDLLSATTPEQEHSTTHRIRKYLNWHATGLDSQKHNISHSNLKTNNLSFNATRQESSLKEVGGNEGLLTDTSKSDAVWNLINDTKAFPSLKEIADDKSEDVDDFTTELKEQISQSQGPKVTKSHSRGNVRYIPQRLHLPSVSKSTTTSENMRETETTTAATVINRVFTTHKSRKFLMKRKLGNSEFSPENGKNESGIVVTLPTLNLELDSVELREVSNQNHEKKPMIEEAKVTKAHFESKHNDEENLFEETGTEIDESLFESNDTTESDLFRIDQSNEDESSMTEKHFQKVNVSLPNSFIVEDVGKKTDPIENVISSTNILHLNEKENEGGKKSAVTREDIIILKSEAPISFQIADNVAFKSRIDGRHIKTENDKLTILEPVLNVTSYLHSDDQISKKTDIENSTVDSEDNTVSSGLDLADFTTVRSTNSDIEEHITTTPKQKVSHIRKYFNRGSEHFTKTHSAASSTNDNAANAKTVTSNPYKHQVSMKNISTHAEHISTYGSKAEIISTIHITENNVPEYSTDTNQSKQEDKMIPERKYLNFKSKDFTALLHKEKNITGHNDTLRTDQQLNTYLKFPTTNHSSENNLPENHSDVEISTGKWKLHRLPIMKPINLTITHSNYNWSSAQEVTTKVGNKSIHMRKYLSMKPKNYFIKPLTDNRVIIDSTDTNFSATHINANSSDESLGGDGIIKIGPNRLHKYHNMKPKNKIENIFSDANSDKVYPNENRTSEDAVTKNTENRKTYISKNFNVELKNDSSIALEQNNVITNSSNEDALRFVAHSSNRTSPYTVVTKRFHMRKYLNLKPKNSSNHLKDNHTAEKSDNTIQIHTNISSEHKTETSTQHNIFHTQKYVSMIYENNPANENTAEMNLKRNRGDTVKDTNKAENYIINMPNVNLETDSSKHLKENSVVVIPHYVVNSSNLPSKNSLDHFIDNSFTTNSTNESIASPYITTNSTNDSLVDTGSLKSKHEKFHMTKYLNLKSKISSKHLRENNVAIKMTAGNFFSYLNSTNESHADASMKQKEHQRNHMRPYLSLGSKTSSNHSMKKDFILNTPDRSNNSPHINITNGNYEGAGKNKTDHMKIHLEQGLNQKFEMYSNSLSENNGITNSTDIYSSPHLIVTKAHGSHVDTNKTEHHGIHMRKYLYLKPKISQKNLTENNVVMNITVAESRNQTQHQRLHVEKYSNLRPSINSSKHPIENNAIVNSTFGFIATPHLNISKIRKSGSDDETNKTKNLNHRNDTLIHNSHINENSKNDSTATAKHYVLLKNDTRNHFSQNSATKKLTIDDTPTTEHSETTHIKPFTSSTVHPTVSGFKEMSTSRNEATTAHNIMHIPKPKHSLPITITDGNEVTTEYSTEVPSTVLQREEKLSILLDKKIIDSALINYSIFTTTPSPKINEVQNEKILLNSTRQYFDEIFDIFNLPISISTEDSLEHIRGSSSNTYDELISSRILTEKIPSSENSSLGNTKAVVGKNSEVPVDEYVQTSSFSTTGIERTTDDVKTAFPQYEYNNINQLLDASPGNFTIENNIAIVGRINEVPVDENLLTSSFSTTGVETATDNETAAIPQHEYNIIHQLLDASSGKFSSGNNIAVVGGISEVPVNERVQSSSFPTTGIEIATEDGTTSISQPKYNIIHQLLDASVTTPISTTSNKTKSDMLTPAENQIETEFSSVFTKKHTEISLVSTENSGGMRSMEQYRNESSFGQNISAETITSFESPKHFPSPSSVLPIQSASENEIANTFLRHIDEISITPSTVTETGTNLGVLIKTAESSVESLKGTPFTNDENKISDVSQYNNERSKTFVISTSSNVTTNIDNLADFSPTEIHEFSTKLPDKFTIISDSYVAQHSNEENIVTSEASPAPKINTYFQYSKETSSPSSFSSPETSEGTETVFIRHKSEFSGIPKEPNLNNSKVSSENRKHIKQEFEETVSQVANTTTLDITSVLNASSNEYATQTINEANIITSEASFSPEINKHFKYSKETPSFSSSNTSTKDEIVYINDTSIYPFSEISTGLLNGSDTDNKSDDIEVMITNNTNSSSVKTDNKLDAESVTVKQIRKNSNETVTNSLIVNNSDEAIKEKDNFASNYSQSFADATTDESFPPDIENNKIVTLNSTHWYGVDVLSTTSQSVISNNDTEYDEILESNTEGKGFTIYSNDEERELITTNDIFSTEQTEQKKEFVNVDHLYGVESDANTKTEIQNTKVSKAGEAVVLGGRINLQGVIDHHFASSENVANQITPPTASDTKVDAFKEVITKGETTINITTIPPSPATKTVGKETKSTSGDDKRFGSGETVTELSTSPGTKVENGLNEDITIGANVVTGTPQYGVVGIEEKETVKNLSFQVENTSEKFVANRYGIRETLENQITSLDSVNTNVDGNFIDGTMKATSKIEVTTEEIKTTQSELHRVEKTSKKFIDSERSHYSLNKLTGIDTQEGDNKSDEIKSIMNIVSQAVFLEKNVESIENTSPSSTNPTSSSHNVNLTENTSNLTIFSNVQVNATNALTKRNESIAKQIPSHAENIVTKFNNGIYRNKSQTVLNESDLENQKRISESGKLDEQNYTGEVNKEVEKAKNAQTSSSTKLNSTKLETHNNPYNRLNLIENTTEQIGLSNVELNKAILITGEEETTYASLAMKDKSTFTKTEELNNNISKGSVENKIKIKQEFEETTSPVVNTTILDIASLLNTSSNKSATTTTAPSSDESTVMNSTIKPISTNSSFLYSKVRPYSEVNLTKVTEDTVNKDEPDEKLIGDVTIVKVEFLEPNELASVNSSTTEANEEETVYDAKISGEVQEEYAVPYIKKKIFENDANFSVQIKIKNETIYMPSDVAINEDPKHLVLNFTWPSSENTFNYSLSLALNESTHGYLINEISLNSLKAGSTLKEGGKLQEDNLSVDSVGGILVKFSNTDFLRKPDKEKNSSNLQKASEKRQDLFFYIEIILVALIVIIMIILVVSILLTKRRKPKTPEVEDRDMTTRL